MNHTLAEDIDRLDGVTPLLAMLCNLTGMGAAGIAVEGIVRCAYARGDEALTVGSDVPIDGTITAPIMTKDGKEATLFAVVSEGPARDTHALLQFCASHLALQLDALAHEHALHAFAHDLRNPIGAISNGAALIARLPLDDRGKSIAAMMQDCTAKMIEMVEALQKKA